MELIVLKVPPDRLRRIAQAVEADLTGAIDDTDRLDLDQIHTWLRYRLAKWDADHPAPRPELPMGHKLPEGQETRELRLAIAEARRVYRELKDAITEASALAPALVTEFETIQRREIAQLSNYFTQECNRNNAALNTAVEQAKDLIINQILSGKAVFNRDTCTVTITFGPVKFAEDEPLPYPSQPVWKAES